MRVGWGRRRDELMRRTMGRWSESAGSSREELAMGTSGGATRRPRIDSEAEEQE